jgi:molybdate transport system substrate-binding protein
MALALFVAPVNAQTLTVVAPASAQAGLQALAAQYTASTGIKVTLGGGARAKVLDAIKTGPADVVVMPTGDMADLPNVTGMIALGRIAVGVGVKAGTSTPDISTPEKFRAALLAAKGVAYADPAFGTSAGKVIASLLSTPEFKNVKRVPVQGLAATALASGSASIALQMLPELATNKDVALAGPVPSAYGLGVDFSVGIATVSNNATEAEGFVTYLTAPQNAALWRKNGLDPLYQ